MSKGSKAKNQEEVVINGEYESVVVEDNVESDTQEFESGSFEKEEDFDPESILDDVDGQCTAIYERSYKITKDFGQNQMSKVMKEAAESLADTLHSIKAQTEPKGFTGKVKSMLPARIQGWVSSASKNMTETKVLNQSVGETTDEIFDKLNGQAAALKEQILQICSMEDGLHHLKEELHEQSEILAKAYNRIAENDGFKGRKALEYKMKEQINTINIHIKEFDSQEERIYQSKFAANNFLEQLKGKLPHIKTSLINGLATMTFMEEVNTLQSNFNNLCQSVNEISVTNTRRIGELMSEITDTARFNRMTMESLQQQEEIQDTTRKTIKTNFENNQKAIKDQHNFLIGVDKKNEEDIKNDVLKSSKSQYFKTPDLIDSDNLLADKTKKEKVADVQSKRERA